MFVVYCTTAVSYTHLDVYKRQVFIAAENLEDSYLRLSVRMNYVINFGLERVRTAGGIEK